MKVCETLNDFQMVLGVCPCCSDVFRLADCKMETSTFSSDEDEFSKVKDERRIVEKMEDQLRRQIETLGLYEEDINAKMAEFKKDAKESGRKEAKERLKKIDPQFSGKDIDPQDVRVLFDPVEYVVFSNMSGEGLDKIKLLGREPKSAIEEKVLKSIDETIVRGDVDFQVISVDEDGEVACDKDAPKPMKSRKKGSSFPVAI